MELVSARLKAGEQRIKLLEQGLVDAQRAIAALQQCDLTSGEEVRALATAIAANKKATKLEAQSRNNRSLIDKMDRKFTGLVCVAIGGGLWATGIQLTIVHVLDPQLELWAVKGVFGLGGSTIGLGILVLANLERPIVRQISMLLKSKLPGFNGSQNGNDN